MVILDETIEKVTTPKKIAGRKPYDASKLYWFHWRVGQMKLGMNARREVFEAHYQCYQKAEKKNRGNILEGTTGLNRDLAHAGKLRERTDCRDQGENGRSESPVALAGIITA